MVRTVKRIRERIRTEGPYEVARSWVSDRAGSALRRLAHRHVAPSLSETNRWARVQTTHPDSFLQAAVAPRTVDPQLVGEFREVAEALRQKYRPELPYPAISAIADAESWVYYALVRTLRPTRVAETGVANGHSSYLLLEALRRNGSGRLLSIDVSNDVGGLVPTSLRGGWDLRILSRRNPRAGFLAALNAAGALDLFIHDSDHSYRYQTLEYAAAWDRLTPTGILASDDIDWSYAFLDFSRSKGRRPLVLVAAQKAFGIVRKSDAPPLARQNG